MNLRFDETTLENGLAVIGEHNPRAQTVAIGYFVNTGSRDETEAVSGVSHFLEHMMFKGTKRRSAHDINREFDELGARYNAYTSHEHTVYYGAVLPERREVLLDLLTDMMRPALRQDDFDLEKNVILEEIAMYQDRATARVFDEGDTRFYGGHPLGNSVLGTNQSIGDLSREQMLGYFQARYAPDNMTLAVAGNYNWEGVLEQVRQTTADWQPRKAGRDYPEFSPQTGAAALSDSKLSRAHVAFYAPGVSAQDELRYAAALLASCLGDGDGSRLYWALVDKGLADEATFSHNSSDGLGAFIGYLSTRPDRLEQVSALYQDVLRELQSEGLTEGEWRRAQRKVATSLTLRGETPFGRLMSLGSSYQYLGRYFSVQEVVDKILATPYSDAERILERNPFDKLFQLSLGPE